MSSEILSQAEIDALLQMIDGPGDAGAWQPGEEEALDHLSTLFGQALSHAGMETWEVDLALQKAQFSIVTPDKVETTFANGLAIGVDLTNGGQMVFLFTEPLVDRIVNRALGGDKALKGLSEQDLASVFRLAGAFMDPLQAALSGVAASSVDIHPRVRQAVQSSGIVPLLEGLGASEFVQINMPYRIDSAGAGEIVIFWPLDGARSFFNLLVREETKARGGAGTATAGTDHGKEHRTARTPSHGEVHGTTFEPLEAIAPSASKTKVVNIDFLLDVPLVLTVELGRTHRPIREILNLVAGSVIELERLAGEPVDVMVNGKLIARGEVVVVDDKFGVRIIDIVSRAERLNKLR